MTIYSELILYHNKTLQPYISSDLYAVLYATVIFFYMFYKLDNMLL